LAPHVFRVVGDAEATREGFVFANLCLLSFAQLIKISDGSQRAIICCVHFGFQPPASINAYSAFRVRGVSLSTSSATRDTLSLVARKLMCVFGCVMAFNLCAASDSLLTNLSAVTLEHRYHFS